MLAVGAVVAWTCFLAVSVREPLSLSSLLQSGMQEAGAFFVESISAEKIRADYAGMTNRVRRAAPERLKILLVPGHQPDTGGTELKGVYERDIVVDVADALARYLNQDARVDVTVARSKTSWHPALQSYFDTHTADIEAFRASQALEMATHVSEGSVLLSADQVYHMTTPTAAALQLYGINKWTNENGYDITLHLHVNDYGGRRRGGQRYEGFAIYVPDHQYSNARASLELGTAIARRLAAYHATSTLPGESAGVVEDQQLIAIGSNNSADAASLLIEYGYIYEPQFQSASVRTAALEEYAYETYLGLRDFFNDPQASPYGSRAFPWPWEEVVGSTGERGPGVYALQAALRYLGQYPPNGKSLSDCPVSGLSGGCTRAAIAAYQRAHGLEETGTLGPQTRAALRRDLPER